MLSLACAPRHSERHRGHSTCATSLIFFAPQIKGRHQSHRESSTCARRQYMRMFNIGTTGEASGTCALNSACAPSGTAWLFPRRSPTRICESQPRAKRDPSQMRDSNCWSRDSAFSPARLVGPTPRRLAALASLTRLSRHHGCYRFALAVCRCPCVLPSHLTATHLSLRGLLTRWRLSSQSSSVLARRAPSGAYILSRASC